MEQQPTNLSIIDGDPFFAHEASIHFTPTQFTLDFKCITPRSDPRSKKASFQLKHSVVMVEPWHYKVLAGIMTQMLEKYEAEFGTIKKPKSIGLIEKKQKTQTPLEEAKTQQPTYFG